jgi:tetratricopeptide (TPR) repeat protein
MRSNNSRTSDPVRLTRAIEKARRLVLAKHAFRALRLLDLLRRVVVNSTARFELETLRVQALIDQGSYREAKTIIESARTLALEPDQQDDLDLLEAQRLARLATAREALRRAFRVLRRNPAGDRAAKAYWVSGIALYRAAHYRWAKECFELSAAHYRIARQPIYLAHVVGNLALVFKNEGKMATALDALDTAMRLYPQRGFLRPRAHCQLHRGICFVRMGDIQSGRTSLLEARQLATKAAQIPLCIAADNHLGHIYRMAGSYSIAKEYYEDALRMAEAERLPRKVALSLEFLAETLTEEGQPAAAIQMLDKALGLAAPLARHGDLVMEILRRRGEAQSWRSGIDGKTFRSWSSSSCVRRPEPRHFESRLISCVGWSPTIGPVTCVSCAISAVISESSVGVSTSSNRAICRPSFKKLALSS